MAQRRALWGLEVLVLEERVGGGESWDAGGEVRCEGC